MATDKKTGSASRSGAKKSSAKKSTAKRSTAKTRSATRRGSSAGPEQNAKTASDNAEATDRKVNEIASEQAAQASADHGDGSRPAKLHPEVEKHLLGTSDEPLSSINSVPKAEGGMPADVIATIRSNLDSVRGESALGQPGQQGHGVGTGTAGMTGPMSDEEIEENEREYARRTKG